MSRSRERRDRSPRWRRNLVALALSPAAIALLSGTTAAVVTGTVTVTKTDASTGAFVKGTTFVVHQGDPTGPVVATPPPTNDKGVTQATLAVGMKYCLEERAVPPGYLKLPTFKPDACFTLTALKPNADVTVTDPPAPGPTPTPTPTPTPSPSPTATGELRVVKTDLTGTPVKVPGFTFNVSLGTTSGQVVATISTDASGTAVAAALTPAVYCVEEIATPDGFQLAPTFSPSACISVAADPTQGHSPSTITVADPPTATPTPSSTPATGASQEPPLGATGSLASSRPSGPGSMGALAKILLGLGALLLVIGGAVITIEIRRRRQTAALELPPDTW